GAEATAAPAVIPADLMNERRSTVALHDVSATDCRCTVAAARFEPNALPNTRMAAGRSARGQRAVRSGEEAGRRPAAVCAAGVGDPVVQPEAALAPELDPLRRDAVARPMRRPRNRGIAETGFEIGDPRFQRRPALQRFGLFRGPGTDLAPARAAGEIGVGLGFGHRFDRSFHAHLPLDRLPEEAERAV